MAKRRSQKRNKVLTSRNYVHRACGEVTEISGPEFESVANPLAEMDETHCGHCEIDDSLCEFDWEDTGESFRTTSSVIEKTFRTKLWQKRHTTRS